MIEDHYADGKLYKDVGQYIILFQALESYLDQMILLAIGLTRFSIGRAVLSKLSNSQKIDVISAAVQNSGVKIKADKFRPEWIAEFRTFIRQCKDEGSVRNSLAHANFIFDFVKIGGPVLKNRNSINKDGVRVQNTALTSETMENSIKQIAKLCWDANFIHIQLIAWSDCFDSSSDIGEPEPER